MAVIEFVEEPEPRLVMPYYPLGHLGDFEGANLEHYVSAFPQILLGLRRLHGRGVVHRDLKPENLLIEEPFTIIIADFGLSKNGREALLTTFCGSPRYCAPEGFPGVSSSYGPKSDIWCAGVILLQLMYGIPDSPEMPKDGVRAESSVLQKWSKTWGDALLKTLYGRDDNDDKVVQLLSQMIVTDPAERLSSDEVLEKGCDSGVFLKSPDGSVVDVRPVDRVVKAPSEATTEIGPAGEVRTPTLRSFRWTGPGTQGARMVAGNLWAGDHLDSDENAPVVSPSALLDLAPWNPEEDGRPAVSPSVILGLLPGDPVENGGVPAVSPPAILDFDHGSFWDGVDGNDRGSFSLLDLLGLGPEAPAHEAATPASNGKSWSLTIGPSATDPDGGFDTDSGPRQEGGVMTGLYIRRDRFTGSFASVQPGQDAAEEEDEVGESEPRQEASTGNNQRQVVSVVASPDSVDERVLQALA